MYRGWFVAPEYIFSDSPQPTRTGFGQGGQPDFVKGFRLRVRKSDLDQAKNGFFNLVPDLLGGTIILCYGLLK